MVCTWNILVILSREFHLTFLGRVPLPRVNKLYSSFYPVHLAGCSLGNNLFYIYGSSMIVLYWAVGIVSTQTRSWTLQHSKPKMLLLNQSVSQSISKAFSGSSWYLIASLGNSFTLYCLVSVVSSFCSPHSVDYFFDDKRT